MRPLGWARSTRPTFGSSAPAFQCGSTTSRGFTVDTGQTGWTAVFGFYTPTTRRTELIPDQVRVLGSLLAEPELAGHEEAVATILLADDRAGTYTLKATP